MSGRRTGAKTVELRCVSCGRAKRFPAASPAAPKLLGCEAARRVGWSFVVDFFAMMTGDYREQCPACAAKAHAEVAS